MIRRDAPYVVTGATRGIGRALVSALVADGAHLILLARDPERGRAVLDEVGPDHELIVCDLSVMDSVREAAAEIISRHASLVGLINCAAVFTRTRKSTPDGSELMFATNHLGPFLLTNLLLPALRSGAPSRILTVSAPATSKVEFDDLQGERRFSALNAFGVTKVCNLMFTFELARRLQGSGVTADAIHPGIARTELMREQSFPLGLITRVFGKPPEQAVRGIVRALEEPGVDGQGRLLKNGQPMRSPKGSTDPDSWQRLWAESERLVGY
ncbi:MAG: SDR family NAD(P)-dependent oxidoreductase [Actinomycetota bacterium]